MELATQSTEGEGTENSWVVGRDGVVLRLGVLQFDLFWDRV